MLPAIPAHFVDDGCSNAPDRIFGVDLRADCRRHDWRYCTRSHAAAVLTQDYRRMSDRELRDAMFSKLCFGTRWVGWIFWRALVRFGGDNAFDSCGPIPDGATDEQLALGLCRHGMERPAWMRSPEEGEDHDLARR